MSFNQASYNILTMKSHLHTQLLYSRVDRSDYLNTFDFLDKIAENMNKKQAQSRL